MINSKGGYLLRRRVLWYFNTIKKFTELKPKCSVLIIIFSILSQVLLLLSFVVPLKMLFVIGVNEFTGLTLGTYTIDTKSELAVVFAIVMTILLGMSFTVEKFSKYTKKRCSDDIWKTNKKFQIYPNQETLATNLYGQYTVGVSGIIFILFILLVLSYLYPLVSVMLILYWIVATFVMVLYYDKSDSFKLTVENELPKVMTSAGLFGFLVIFIAVIIDFISPAPSNTIIYAFISLILIRHMTGSITASVQSIKMLYTHKQQLEAIFFKGYGNQIVINNKESKFWQLFEEEYYKKWIPEVLENILHVNISCKSYEWYELGIPNVITFIITIERKDDLKLQEKYMVKVFNKNLHVKALKEATLYTECDLTELSTEFIGVSMIGAYDCHVFKYGECMQVEQKDFLLNKFEMLSKIVDYQLPNSILVQYKTTHEFIYNRFSSEIFERMKVSADEDETNLLAWFKQELENITEEIHTLPLRLVVPHITRNTLVVDSTTKSIKLISFDNWSIEPVGYGFAPSPKEREILEELLSEQEYKKALIVQELKACEHHCNRHSFKLALENIKKIKEIYKGDLKK